MNKQACGTNLCVTLDNFSAGISGMSWVLSLFLPDDTVSSFVMTLDGLVCLELGFTNSTLHISAWVTYMHTNDVVF